MRQRRVIADEVSGDRAVITGTHAKHLSRVLRTQVGQHFEIATATGVREGTVTLVEEVRVEFKLGPALPLAKTPTVTLALAIFKFDRMEWAIEKCAELGATTIIPVISERTQAHLAAAAAKRVERWKRIVHQAAEQSRRAGTLEITSPIKLDQLLALSARTRIVLSEVEKEISLKEAISDAEETLLAIGPEGGWTEAELELFREAGWTSASLSGNILRAETAAIVALAIVLHETT